MLSPNPLDPETPKTEDPVPTAGGAHAELPVLLLRQLVDSAPGGGLRLGHALELRRDGAAGPAIPAELINDDEKLLVEN